MELPETIETLNQRLTDHYGLFENGKPNYRIVWSDDQYEQKIDSELGFQVVPKYNYAKSKYVLEKLIPVDSPELLSNLSYEPIWIFHDKYGFPLPPIWPACELIIKTIHEQMRKIGKGPKYKDPENTMEEELEAKEKRIKELSEALFGNETDVTDAMMTRSAVVKGDKNAS